MNIHIYRQADSRWASLPYPGRGYNFGPNACGACAVLHCIIEMDKYKNWTPKDIQPYMKQFATYGSGTTWAGIQKALVHYGLKDVANIPTMPQLWRELEKGNRVGVLLFGSTHGPDGTVWTTGGHYIAFTGYRVKNGQHQLYLKDSGGRKHDGWYSYERSMKGDVRQVWIGRLPNGHEVDGQSSDTTPAPSTDGKLTVDGIGGAATIKALQKYLKMSVQDGKLSGQNKSLHKYYPSITSVSYGSGGSATVKALQKWVGVSVDGIWGQSTSKALQKKLGVTADGIFGAKSVKALQKFLNSNNGGGGTSTTKTSSTTTAPSQTPAPSTPANFRENIIDVSYVQSKTIDWNKVKADGVHGAIIRCGYRGYGSGALNEDSMFMNHITGANKAGLKLGIYFFTEAINAAEGKAEAQFALKMLKKAGVKLTYPIAIDTENINAKNPAPRANSTKLSAAKRTEAIKAFCEEIKANGYEPMIYASTSWLNNQLQMSKLPYTVWVAQYNDRVTYGGKYAIWQYTSTARVNGINQVVDKNYCYVNYSTPTIQTTTTQTITPTVTPTTSAPSTSLKSTDVVAQEVLDGKWGSGQTRKDKLVAAGYNYDAVQTKVNELIIYNQKITQIAYEVLDGKWGSGETRKQKLTAAGYNYDVIQKKVNELLQSNTTVYKNMTAWAKRIANEKYHYVRWKSNISATHTCPICSGRKYDNYYGWNCIGFAWACWHHGGGLKTKCNCSVIDNGTGDKILKVNDAEALKLVQNHCGIQEVKVIKNGGKAIPLSMLQEGDIILFYKDKTYYHTAYYMGNGKYADSNTTSGIGHANNIRANLTLSSTAKANLKVAIRYIGTTIPKTLKSIDVVAQEVLDGKWGSGTARKTALINAGYDYDKVQAKVNELLKSKETTPAPSEPTPEPTPEPTYNKEKEVVDSLISQFTTKSLLKIIELLLIKINQSN